MSALNERLSTDVAGRVARYWTRHRRCWYDEYYSVALAAAARACQDWTEAGPVAPAWVAVYCHNALRQYHWLMRRWASPGRHRREVSEGAQYALAEARWYDGSDECGEQAQRWLALLPDREALAVSLRVLSGLSWGAVCDVMAIRSRATCGRLVARGLRLLRDVITIRPL